MDEREQDIIKKVQDKANAWYGLSGGGKDIMYLLNELDKARKERDAALLKLDEVIMKYSKVSEERDKYKEKAKTAPTFGTREEWDSEDDMR